MSKLSFFYFSARINYNNQYENFTLKYAEDLPFPLSMSYTLRVTIGIIIILILIGGLTFRGMIFKYLRSPDAKSNQINSLIWIDQICGLVFGSFNLIYGSITLILPFSLRSLMGSRFCDWVPLGACLNLTGYIIWSALIAVYRILYIKAQNWIAYKVGNKTILKLFIFLGFFLQLSLSMAIFYFDDESVFGKGCNHFSSDDLEIFQEYRVS